MLTYTSTDDTTVNTKRAVIWTSIHVIIAFVCACLPMYKPLFIKISEISSKFSQFALSFMGLRNGSRHSRGSPHAKAKNSNSKDSFPLGSLKYENITEIEGGNSVKRGDMADGPKNSIAVTNKVVVNKEYLV